MDSDAVEEAAARWFARHESGSWSESDQAAFDSWLNAATAHRIAYIRIETAWHHGARMKALGAGIPAGVIPPRGAWGNVRFFKGAKSQTHPSISVGEDVSRHYFASPVKTRFNLSGARRHVAVAAGLLLAVAVGLYAYKTVLPQTDYSTKVGGLNALSLSDGSRITLNTNSHVRVALEQTQRRIELDKGEAFFEVAHDPNRPFVVEVGNKRVIAVGTAFSVRRNDNDIRVAVTKGKVRVEDISASLRMQDKDAKGAADVLVGAGGIAQTANAEILVVERTAPEVEQLLSWRTGYLVFRDTTIADAVAEFNRYNARQIVIEDPAVSAIRIGGNFRSTNTEAFLWLIQQGFPIDVVDGGDEVILRHR